MDWGMVVWDKPSNRISPPTTEQPKKPKNPGKPENHLPPPKSAGLTVKAIDKDAHMLDLHTSIVKHEVVLHTIIFQKYCTTYMF